uniref:Uncharacterized protein n=1 Tax=Plectus sambesii TaxID=2011161 RepID=A0A914WI48_9BILA
MLAGPGGDHRGPHTDRRFRDNSPCACVFVVLAGVFLAVWFILGKDGQHVWSWLAFATGVVCTAFAAYYCDLLGACIPFVQSREGRIHREVAAEQREQQEQQEQQREQQEQQEQQREQQEQQQREQQQEQQREQRRERRERREQRAQQREQQEQQQEQRRERRERRAQQRAQLMEEDQQ